jgi:hypothetical protein
VPRRRTSTRAERWSPALIIAGAGLGLILGPASTDAVNRAPSTSYSEVTGITQTGRNFGASLGLAMLGTILIAVIARLWFPRGRVAVVAEEELQLAVAG